MAQLRAPRSAPGWFIIIFATLVIARQLVAFMDTQPMMDEFKIRDEDSVRVFGEYTRSSYRPSLGRGYADRFLQPSCLLWSTHTTSSVHLRTIGPSTGSRSSRASSRQHSLVGSEAVGKTSCLLSLARRLCLRGACGGAVASERIVGELIESRWHHRRCARPFAWDVCVRSNHGE